PIESEGLREELFENLCIPLGTGVAGSIAESAGGLIFNDLADVEVVSPFLRKRVRSLVGVPLRSGDTLVGVLHVGAATPRVFTEADLDFLRRVADRAVLAIDRAHLAESERHARAEAEQANRSKDEFLAVLSHELRTPLTAMLGWVKLLRAGRVSPAQTERALESIERNTRLQARLIEDLLDLSRAITGKLLLDLRPVALGPIVQDAAESLAGAAAEKGVKLTVAPDPATVRGDALRLGQVVTNLVGNAVKFTPAGGDITVRLERVGNDACLTVRDTGFGIDPDLLPHIFDRFRQADAGGSRRQAGLGLGLAIVRNLVELHAGTVRAESDGPGRRATVPVTALTRPEDRQRALGAGFDAFLTKPVDPHAFVRVAVSVAASSESA